MTPADLARQNAIPLEIKKDGLQQRQNGDWVLRVVIQAADMDERITKAAMGTRFQAALVIIGDDELPIQQEEKETKAPSPKSSPPPTHPPAAAKRMDWRELQPAAQAGIRSDDAVFWSFLHEEHCYPGSPVIQNKEDAARVIRTICNVQSRSELGTNHKARVLWKQLDDQFQAWQRIGA